ncbi:hypothetical protein MLOOGBEN_26840 [Bacillus sp. EB106-08-02-XG196]|uniref:hypothetical protein n=1 Tax=Bacillus sp. EB106-08-02-XG196 TaxID=2737049 RepID=UPI0015C40F88|nr:hypothetical protein [Bacillus sp. EB106-08-02-XG196]NWQ44309.1 hypothetical protein [Bacillus sp. EB106-08-02-XG196]
MAVVKSVKIDGENIYIFNSAIYIFESHLGYTLELDLLVSEVTERKYKKEQNLIIEIELENGRLIDSIMHLKSLSGGLPQLNLFCDLNDIDEFGDLDRVNESSSWFPNVEEGVTLEEIRKVEMPNENISLKVNLPINQVEWLKKQKKSSLNEMLQEFITEYWKKQE